MTTSPTSHASSLPPAVAALTPIAWMRKHLFNSWFNSLLTIVLVLVLGRMLIGFVIWATAIAKWQVIPANLPLFFAGRYPASQYWRLWILLGMLVFLAGLSWGILARNVPRLLTRNVLIALGIVAAIIILIPTSLPYRLLLLALEALMIGCAIGGQQLGRRIPAMGKWLSLAWMLSFFVALWLMAGGLGLRPVEGTAWGGLLLTVFMAVVSMVLSFPFGVLLALGRQSPLPIIRWLSTFFIEIVRGTPILATLFIALLMVPLFLPAGSKTDLVARGIIGLTLFAAAYLAETVRGGLQAIPKGQYEAASAVGLNTPLTLALIVLPQALKISIPAIVGLFIDLVQETTLVSIVGLAELLGTSRSILANPLYIGRYAEVYLFIGVLYWVICYLMSWGSRRLEQQLDAGR